MDRQQAFTRLKPSCVRLLQAAANISQKPIARTELVQSLEQLLSTLQSVAVRPGTLDARLAEYAFVPISQVLRISRTVPIRALELCLECISVLLRVGWGDGPAPELSGQLLILFTFMAKPSSVENGISGTSEELQTLAFKCLAELLTQVSRTVEGRQALTATINVPALGEAVLVTLDSLTATNSNSIKIQALACIKALITAIDDKDALASFLPGIVTSLTKLLTPSSSNRTGFRALQEGLNAVYSIFLRLLSDKETENLPRTAQQDQERQPQIIRTSSWLQATASQIKIALANIMKLRNHDKAEVQQALLKLCITIVQECRKSLSDCVGMAIEVMVTLAGRVAPGDVVETDLKILLATDPSLSTLLRESLHGWVIALPRQMKSKDDNTRRQLIHQISVTLRLLNQEQQAMLNDLLADNIRDGVSAILSDSKGRESIVGTGDLVTFNKELVISRESSSSFEPMRLRFKGQEDMMSEFHLLLTELSKSNTAMVVAQQLAGNLDVGSQENRLASFWICVNLIRDAMATNPPIDDFVDFGSTDPHEELLDNLYSHSLIVLGQQSLGACSAQSHALALEVLALQVTRYKTEFRAELSETLYPVLYYLGSSDIYLRNHAIACLNIMAESCGYSSASEMVIANVDYIVNAVGLKLSYGDVAPQAPQVLLMMMRLCGPSLLPYLDDLVGSIFGALERYHGYPQLVELLFAALRGMAEEGVKAPQLAIIAVNDDDQNTRGTDERERILDIIAQLRKVEEELHKLQEPIEDITQGSFPHQAWGDIEDEHQQEEGQPAKHNPEPPDPLPPAPRAFAILLKISDLTQHYLTSSSPSLRASLLSLLNTTIPTLAKHENSFLPLINTLWPVLLPRLQDPEAYVVAAALDTIALLCTHAGNFMRTRIEAAWRDLKAVYRRTVKKTDDHEARRGGATDKVKHTSLLIAGLSQTLTSTSIATTSVSQLALPTPMIYIDTPTRMIHTSFTRLLCAISAAVTYLSDALFDEVLGILEPQLLDREVRRALEKRNADAVWLRMYRKSMDEAEPMKEAFARVAGVEGLGERRGRLVESAGQLGWVEV